MPVPLYQAKAEFFRMLGHPVRIRVLELLQDGPMPVRDLLASIEVERSDLSQQLAVLRRSGIVTELLADQQDPLVELRETDAAEEKIVA
ncbi:ArsR/SmtB family transcription factor [Streptacidiphilus sp. N1-3]|uniref:ArsR/SmtB family transcription factor n=1 Tax=Streptacidiphilus alkalitolerans TaxID=3342712 RepID=A0ABV6WZG6_9ACTN